jgi:hypothetical protein
MTAYVCLSGSSAALCSRLRSKETLDKNRSIASQNPQFFACGPLTMANDAALAIAAEERITREVAAETLGVSRSNLRTRLSGSAQLRRRHHEAQDGKRRNATGTRPLQTSCR